MGSANDMNEANKTYNSFIAIVKWAVPILAILTGIIVVTISS